MGRLGESARQAGAAAVITATHVTQQCHITLRAHKEDEKECEASECNLLCEDMLRANFSRFVVDPGVRQAYFPNTARQLYTKKVPRPPHPRPLLLEASSQHGPQRQPPQVCSSCLAPCTCSQQGRAGGLVQVTPVPAAFLWSAGALCVCAFKCSARRCMLLNSGSTASHIDLIT